MNKFLLTALACICLAACDRQPAPTPPGSDPAATPQPTTTATGPTAGNFSQLAPDAGPSPTAWSAPIVARLDSARQPAVKERAKLQIQADDANARMFKLMDESQSLQPPAIGTVESPDNKSRCEAVIAEKAKTMAQHDAVRTALQNHPTPETFNTVQAQLRRALAYNQLKTAETVLTDFEHVSPSPSADQWDALQADLAIFSQRGGEPFRAGLPPK